MKRAVLGLLATGMILIAGGGLATTAHAATTIGQTFVPDGTCGRGTYLQSTSPGDSYTVPTAGVITGWSHEAPASNAVAAMKLKVGRMAATDSYAIVGESQLTPIVAGQLNTFTDVRIPVLPGDLIGFYFASPAAPACVRLADPSYGVTYDTGGADVPPGPPADFAPTQSGAQLDVAASLEPDADGDGYGDETQDQCPTLASTHGSCPPPETTLNKTPKSKTKQKQATFEFGSDQPSVTFECSLDGAAFSGCITPRIVMVGKGKHIFQVRALNPDATDATPASYGWKVVKKKHKHHHGGHHHR